MLRAWQSCVPHQSGKPSHSTLFPSGFVQKRNIVNDTEGWYKKFKWIAAKNLKKPTPPPFDFSTVPSRIPGKKLSEGFKPTHLKGKNIRIPYVETVSPVNMIAFRDEIDEEEARKILGISSRVELDKEKIEETVKWATFNNHPDLGGSNVVPRKIEQAREFFLTKLDPNAKKPVKQPTIFKYNTEGKDSKTKQNKKKKNKKEEDKEEEEKADEELLFDSQLLMDVDESNYRDQFYRRNEKRRRSEYFYRSNEHVLGGDRRDLILRHFSPTADYFDRKHPIPHKKKLHILGNINSMRSYYGDAENYPKDLATLFPTHNQMAKRKKWPKEYEGKLNVMNIVRGNIPPFLSEEWQEFFNQPKSEEQTPEYTHDNRPFIRKSSIKERAEKNWMVGNEILEEERELEEAIVDGIAAGHRTGHLQRDEETGAILSLDPQLETEAEKELKYEEEWNRGLAKTSYMDYALNTDLDVEESKDEGIQVLDEDLDFGDLMDGNETTWDRDHSGMYVWRHKRRKKKRRYRKTIRTTKVYYDQLPEQIQQMHPTDRVRAIMAFKKIPGSFLDHFTPRWGNPFFGLEREYFGLDGHHLTHPGTPKESKLFYDEGGDPLGQKMLLDWYNAKLTRDMEDAADMEEESYWLPIYQLILDQYEAHQTSLQVIHKLNLLPTEKMTMKEILYIARPLILANQPTISHYQDHEMILNYDVKRGEQPKMNIQSLATEQDANYFAMREWLQEMNLWDLELEEPELFLHQKKKEIEWEARNEQFIMDRKEFANEIIYRKAWNEMAEIFEEMIPIRDKLFRAAFHRKARSISNPRIPLTPEERKMMTPELVRRYDHEYRVWLNGEKELTADYDEFERAFQKLKHDLDRLHRFIKINTGKLDREQNNQLGKRTIDKKKMEKLVKREEYKVNSESTLTLEQVKLLRLEEKEKKVARWNAVPTESQIEAAASNLLTNEEESTDGITQEAEEAEEEAEEKADVLEFLKDESMDECLDWNLNGELKVIRKIEEEEKRKKEEREKQKKLGIIQNEETNEIEELLGGEEGDILEEMEKNEEERERRLGTKKKVVQVEEEQNLLDFSDLDELEKEKMKEEGRTVPTPEEPKAKVDPKQYPRDEYIEVLNDKLEDDIEGEQEAEEEGELETLPESKEGEKEKEPVEDKPKKKREISKRAANHIEDYEEENQRLKNEYENLVPEEDPQYSHALQVRLELQNIRLQAVTKLREQGRNQEADEMFEFIHEQAQKDEENDFAALLKRASTKRELPVFEGGMENLVGRQIIVGKEWDKWGVENFDDSPDAHLGFFQYGTVDEWGPDPLLARKEVLDQNGRLLPKDSLNERTRLSLLALDKADRIEARRIIAEQAEGIYREWKDDLHPFSKANAKELLMRHGAFDVKDQIRKISEAMEEDQKSPAARQYKKLVSSLKSALERVDRRRKSVQDK